MYCWMRNWSHLLNGEYILIIFVPRFYRVFLRLPVLENFPARGQSFLASAWLLALLLCLALDDFPLPGLSNALLRCFLTIAILGQESLYFLNDIGKSLPFHWHSLPLEEDCYFEMSMCANHHILLSNHIRVNWPIGR